jgi:hypothetical protein
MGSEEEVPQLGAKDLSRRRDRQAAIVLAVAAAVGMFIFFPLGPSWPSPPTS